MVIRGKEHRRAAIVGLGNILLMDDGVGVHALRTLSGPAPEGIVLAEVGTALLDALELLASVEVVVAIDAVAAGGRPGSIYCLNVNDAQVRTHVSLHELGIAAALQLLPTESRPRVLIVGVEPAVIDYGMRLSPAVQAVLPQVTRVACSMAELLMHGTDCELPQDFLPCDRQLESNRETI